VGFDILNPLRLASGWVDREHDDAVLAALEYLLPLIILGLLRAVRAIDNAAVWVNMHCTRCLPGANVFRFGERAGDKGGRRRQPPVCDREHHYLVLRLDRDVDPGLCRMEI